MIHLPKSMCFKQWITTLLLSSCFLTAPTNAEEASFAGSVLSIPVVVVGNSTYSVELTLVAGSEPIEFLLTGASEIFDVSTLGASNFAGETLSIPSLTVEGVSYWVDLQLTGSEPITFGLAGFGQNTGSTQQEADALLLFESTISPNLVQATCIECHIAGGLARDSILRFVNPKTASELNNFEAFRQLLEIQENGVEYILSKVRGKNHGGGVQLIEGSQSYQDLVDFLALLNNVVEATNQGSSFFGGSILQSNVDTLRRAAIILAGRLPTATELSAVRSGDDDELRATLRGLMQGEGFHNFLTEGTNDRLLADNSPGFMGVNFPYYLNENYRLLKEAAENPQADQNAVGEFNRDLSFGIGKAVDELIAYVVEQERPYSEILTADYTMMNWAMNLAFHGTATFEHENSRYEFQPGKIEGYYGTDESVIIDHSNEILLGPFIVDFGNLNLDPYPHAGVLSTKGFLTRYPSTATNRNRARARWTLLHFLGIDIEKSASRTTDPIALADRQNPTLNNSNCTVCHRILDPIAGAFQNYGDRGFYRSNFGFLDSLDEFYKNPEDGSPSPYQHGDTWYRDMLSPGIFDREVPESDYSLQWLGEQIVAEPSFALAAVHFWWPSLMGSDALSLPEVEEDFTYHAQLIAYEAQSASISALANYFREEAAFNLKDLLVEMMMTPWFRVEKVAIGEFSEAQSIAQLGNEKLLTPEQLQRKMLTVTGFNWGSYHDHTEKKIASGLGDTYRLYYGGIDSDAVTQRSTQMTPLMSNVALSMALESACPIVLKEFVLPDEDRKLFFGIDDLTQPFDDQEVEGSVNVEVANTELFESQDFELVTNLSSGDKDVTVRLNNHFCEIDPDSQSCVGGGRYIEGRQIEVFPPQENLPLQVIPADLDYGCGTDVAGVDWGIYDNCSVSFPFSAQTEGEYRIVVSMYQNPSGSEHAQATIEVVDLFDSPKVNLGNEQINREKLVDLHELMLGKTYSTDSPEIDLAYRLLSESWLARRENPNQLQSTLGAHYCDYSRDINFGKGLGIPDDSITIVDGNGNLNPNYDAINDALADRDAYNDPVNMKQTWVSILTYLMTHYHFLHE